MEMFTTATGLETKQVDMAYTPTRRDLDTRAIGRMTSNTAKAMKLGPREPATRVNTLRAKKKDGASILGAMGQFMKANGEITKLMASESTSGLTEENTSDSGEVTTCQAMAFTCILTV